MSKLYLYGDDTLGNPDIKFISLDILLISAILQEQSYGYPEYRQIIAVAKSSIAGRLLIYIA